MIPLNSEPSSRKKTVFKTSIHHLSMNILKSLLVWLCFIPIAILNGGFREHILQPIWGTRWALPLSGIILSILIFIATWTFLPRLGKFKQSDSYLIAFLWVVLTIIFEFSFGLSNGLTLMSLLQAYNPANGNLWILVVASTACSPILSTYFQSKRHSRA